MKPGVRAVAGRGGSAGQDLSEAAKNNVFTAQKPFFRLAISFPELLISGSYGISGRVILAVRF
jgi:hypothetical protein